jgi:plasmid stability protein
MQALYRHEREAIMPTLTVRRLDDRVYSQLQSRAKKHGLSMEAEARRILTNEVAPEPSLVSAFAKMRDILDGEELVLPERSPSRDVEFGW